MLFLCGCPVADATVREDMCFSCVEGYLRVYFGGAKRTPLCFGMMVLGSQLRDLL